jgi:hypothetical protein
MNNKERILKKLLFDIFDKLSKDADVYNHNGSLWLINTDSTRWIFEFTKSKTLWYNYNFFRSALKFVSLDVNEGDNQKYITEWFESRYLNINQVKHTHYQNFKKRAQVEDTIQNGVKDTKSNVHPYPKEVRDTIQNGVKDMKESHFYRKSRITDVTQDGVKETELHKGVRPSAVGDAIQNGVKRTLPESIPDSFGINDAIQNGVKETKQRQKVFQFRVDGTIQNGVKETKKGIGIPSSKVDDTIQNGVKEIQPLPAQDGNMDWGLYYQRQEDRTKPHIEYVRDVIEEHHHRRREVIVTIKDGVKETHQDCSNNTARVEGIIRVGEKLD